jgi:hypothetical protein
LNHICKRFETNLKTGKGKKEKDKERKGRGELFGLVPKASPGPQPLLPERVSASLSSSTDRWAPLVGTFLFLW